MKRLVFTYILLTFVSSLLFAQQYNIVGRVVSQTDGQGIEMATVRLFSYKSKDSILVQGAQTDLDGYYALTNIKQGTYKLYISSVGYKEQSRQLTVTDTDLSVPVFRLKEDIQALAEVSVQGHAAEMTVKGDTLEYNTAAYQVGENAMVEDLLKKMNGIEVDTEGNVKVNGENITGIRIDGKKFFGNDVQAATKNIPAEMIEKIQVIDEKSDMAKLTGFDDDESERIINLTLKSDRKKGIFGNFTGGLGADMVADNGNWFDYNKYFFNQDFRYNASVFLNILLGESQTTIIGGANNTNEMRTGRGRGGMQGSNSGITWAENIGVNTNISGKNGWLYGGDAQMTHSQNQTFTKSEKTEWTDDYTYNRNDSTAKVSNTWDAKTRLEFEWQIDSLNELIIKPEISYTNTQSNSYRQYDYLRNGDTTTVGSQTNKGEIGTIGVALKLIYNHKFLKPGRTLTLNGNINFNNSVSNSENISENISYTSTPLASIHQWTDKTQNALSYDLKASFVEPLFNNRHFLETAISFSHNSRWSDKNQYNDSARTQLDYDYSNSLTNFIYSEALEVNYKWREEYFDLTAGLKLNPSQTVSHTLYGNDSTLSRSRNVWNFSPNASFKYKFGKKEFARIQYRGTTAQPSIDQMEPVKDNSNAMNETVGNMDLVPSFKHTLQFMYSKFNQERFSSIMTGLRASLTKDALVRNNIYDDAGKLYQQTVNATGLPWSIDANVMYNTPFAQKMLQFHTRTSIAYSTQLAYVMREQPADLINTMIENNTWQLGDESRTGNLRAQEDLTLRFTHSIVDIGVRGSFTYSRTDNNLTIASASNVFNWSVTGDITFHLPKSWEISSDIGYQDRIGYGRDLGKLSEIMWNASISKTWTDASLSLKCTDILNQRKNIVQIVGENSVQYQRYNTLPTYFMLSFTYKLNRMGGLKASGKAAVMQDMIENTSPSAAPSRQPQEAMPPMGPPPSE